MDQQALAVRLAEESIQRYGFVVVGYVRDAEIKIGEQTSILWRHYPMPQPFTVIRQATAEEFDRQIALFREITGLAPHPDTKIGTPLVLVTD